MKTIKVTKRDLKMYEAGLRRAADIARLAVCVGGNCNCTPCAGAIEIAIKIEKLLSPA